MESQLTFNDIKKFIKRRKKFIVGSIFLILPIAVGVALALPPIYRADTTILRESQQVSEDYIRSTITDYAEERLEASTQQVMSRANLIQIIDAFNLYPDMRAKKPMGEIILKMKQAVLLETVYAKVTNERTGRATSINTAFKLSYEGKDPYKVQKVTNTLASLYIELEKQSRGRRASATTIFFEDELENLKEQIEKQEEKIRYYKEAHIGELPENYATNERTLDRLERNLNNTEARLQTLIERKLFLEGQISTVDPLLPITTDEGKVVVNPSERLKRLRLKLLSLESTLSDKHPDIQKLKSEISNLEEQVGRSDEAAMKVKRLGELEEELAVAKGRLGPKHPDIVKMEKEIKDLRQEVDNLETEKMISEVREQQPDNPTYINLKTQIFIVESEIKQIERDISEIKNSLEEYRKRIERTPLIEKEYNELTRNYVGLKRKYDDISAKLMEAKIAQGMEEGQFGERFIIVDPASLPEKPYKPNRIAIVVLGFLLAFGVGTGLALIQESTDLSIKTVEELNQITGGNVFSVVSMIETDKEKRSKRIKRFFWVASFASGVVIALVVTNQFVMPLKMLWIVLKRRMMGI